MLGWVKNKRRILIKIFKNLISYFSIKYLYNIRDTREKFMGDEDKIFLISKLLYILISTKFSILSYSDL